MVPTSNVPDLSDVDIHDIRFETDRLILRTFTKNDFDVLHNLRRQADVVRYLYGEAHTAEQTREVLGARLKMISLDKDGDKLILAVEEKATGAFVGDLVLILKSRSFCQGELGFVFNPNFHGKGYGYESSKEILGFGFEKLGLHR
ncbi:MAG: GNAT family N-acetyltransferase [Halopseudomonas aestusnigri]